MKRSEEILNGMRLDIEGGFNVLAYLEEQNEEEQVEDLQSLSESPELSSFAELVESVIDSEDITRIKEVLDLKEVIKELSREVEEKMKKYKEKEEFYRLLSCYSFNLYQITIQIHILENEYYRIIQKENIKQITPTKKEVTFYDKIIGTEEEKQETLSLLNRAINGKKGKDIILILRGAFERGLLTRPTYTQAKKAFNNIGSRALYNRYFSDLYQLSQLEERNINAIFRNKE